MSHKEVPPIENYGAHWGFTSYQGKVVLDLGADYGSTACFFFKRGATKVIAVEGDKTRATELFANYGNEPNVICIEKMVRSVADIEYLVTTYKPDLVKMDIEGDEIHLLEVPPDIICSINEWLVEPHDQTVRQKLCDLFISLKYEVQIQGEPNVIWARREKNV